MNSRNLVLRCTIDRPNRTLIQCPALVDSGATGYAFINRQFAQNHEFSLVPLPFPRDLSCVDGSSPLQARSSILQLQALGCLAIPRTPYPTPPSKQLSILQSLAITL